MAQLRKIFSLSIGFLFCTTMFSQSQVYVNKLWSTSFGAPQAQDWSASTLDLNGDLLTTGHSGSYSNAINLVLRKQDPSGNTIWETNFGTITDTNELGTLIQTDLLGNIYVAGVQTKDGTIGSHDMLLLKYSPDGVLIWTKIYEGEGEGDDIPTGLTLDAFGHLYLTGWSKGLDSELDYLTIKLDQNSGQLIWQRSYDFAQEDDIPIDIALDNAGNILVIGGSASTPFNWEIALIKYSNTGDLLEEKRLSNQALEFNMPSDFTRDDQGNLLITGITSLDGINYNIRTLKLNGSLDLEWMHDFDSGALMDSVAAIQSDPFGNVVISAWATNQNEGTESIVIKYNQDGELLWKKRRTSNPSTSIDKPMALKINDAGDIFIAAEVRNENQSYISVSQYDINGNIKWNKRLNENENSFNIPSAILLNELGELYVTAISKDAVLNKYTCYKLACFEREMLEIEDAQGNPSHISKEIVLRLQRDVVNYDIVNNVNLRFVSLGDLIQDQECLDQLDQELEAEGSIGDWRIIKVHRKLTQADSIAFTASGKKLIMPDFYNTYILSIPERYDNWKDERAICEVLNNSTFNSCIRVAELNILFSVDDCEPNDDLYPTQGNLHPTEQYPTGHVNMEAAWCIDAGQDHIKVAVVGTGVNWDHEDFNGPSFENSVIDGGYDYQGNQAIENDPHTDADSNHETKVASIIGAVRNNSIGVAGIAGGNYENGSPNGVRLYPFKIGGSLSAVLQSWMDAVQEYNCDVINFSGGTPNFSALYREQMHFANRMGVIQVGSRGNTDDGNGPHYPATMQDEWVLCVGGTGVFGFFNPECAIGPEMDVAAPSRWQLVRTIDLGQPTTYGGMSFTSAAAPHIAAMGALMRGYYTATEPNLVLVQEDIEYVLQMTADDVAIEPAQPGYDIQTGFGKINAGNAMKLIERPNCSIFHFGTDTDPHTKSVDVLEENINLNLTETYTSTTGVVVNAGNYLVDVYKVTATVNHTLPADLTEVNHSWERHSNATTFELYQTNGNLNSLQALEKVNLLGNPTASSANLEGYVYRLKNSSGNTFAWIPAPIADVELTYSLIACKSLPLATESPGAKEEPIFIYPNPTETEIHIQGLPFQKEALLVQIFDAKGSIVKDLSIEMPSQKREEISLNCKDLAPGIYYCKLISAHRIWTKKFIKL